MHCFINDSNVKEVKKKKSLPNITFYVVILTALFYKSQNLKSSPVKLERRDMTYTVLM
jgi:hypothetical protein